VTAYTGSSITNN